ncbi:porin OmpL1 [Leptospira andrefontaineae]|uniref:Porin OmpL1 n=2 Tax=Leptospira andrefontaineae TaxID=2484976 RepID=A0A4R9GY01_9LEPT|nr:porin OmpL1 [Leptospira andrefontaineae]
MFLLGSSTLSAKSYVFGSLGAQFNLGNLGDVITKDGLDASSNYDAVSSTGQTGVLPRRVLYPDNRLLSLQHSTMGLIHANTGGPLTGGVISLGYEQDFGKNFFWRVSANYTKKIMGGESDAKFLQYKFYDITWDYSAIQIPVNVGIKISPTEDTAIYIGAGVHYFKGGWGLAGSNRAEDVHQFLAQTLGPTNTITNLLEDGTDPNANWENTRFNVSGVAPNWLFGVQARVSDKGYAFMEAETFFSFKYGIAHPSSQGGAEGLAPSVGYPIVLGGTQYRIGYKYEI